MRTLDGLSVVIQLALPACAWPPVPPSVLLDASFSAPTIAVALNGLVGSNTYCLIQLNAKCYDSPMATTLSTALQTLSLQAPSLQTLPDDIQQRVLAGVPLDDHQATASACKAFRAVIRGPKFLALRRRYGFAERGVVVVGNIAPGLNLKIITSGITTSIFEGVRVSTYGSTVTTNGGSRLFFSGSSEQILEFNVSSRRWKRLTKIPQETKGMHICEWHDGNLYVAGGLATDRHGFACSQSSVFAFSEATGLWEELPHMPHAACCQAPSGIIGNQLFIACGQSPTGELTLQIYDIATRTWNLGPPPPDRREEGYIYSGSHGLVVDGKLCLVAWCMPLLWYDPQSETWTDSESYPSAPPQLQAACVHNGRIIVFLANGHGGGTLVRAADGSWAPYEGVGDSAEAEALTGEGDELMKKGDFKGANAKYSEAAAVGDEPAAGWGPRNAFSFASAPAGAAKHCVSASVLLG